MPSVPLLVVSQRDGQFPSLQMADVQVAGFSGHADGQSAAALSHLDEIRFQDARSQLQRSAAAEVEASHAQRALKGALTIACQAQGSTAGDGSAAAQSGGAHASRQFQAAFHAQVALCASLLPAVGELSRHLQLSSRSQRSSVVAASHAEGSVTLHARLVSLRGIFLQQFVDVGSSCDFQRSALHARSRDARRRCYLHFASRYLQASAPFVATRRESYVAPHRDFRFIARHCRHAHGPLLGRLHAVPGSLLKTQFGHLRSLSYAHFYLRSLRRLQVHVLVFLPPLLAFFPFFLAPLLASLSQCQGRVAAPCSPVQFGSLRYHPPRQFPVLIQLQSFVVPYVGALPVYCEIKVVVQPLPFHPREDSYLSDALPVSSHERFRQINGQFLPGSRYLQVLSQRYGLPHGAQFQLAAGSPAPLSLDVQLPSVHRQLRPISYL